MYQIKKTLGEEVLYTPKRSIVEISSQVDLKIDVSDLLDKENLEIYTGPFLQGYNVKNAENFEDWILGYREFCRERFTEMAYDQVEDGASENVGDIIRIMSIVIKVDPYDERAYRIIMQAYSDSGHMNKAFKNISVIKNPFSMKIWGSSQMLRPKGSLKGWLCRGKRKQKIKLQQRCMVVNKK